MWFEFQDLGRNPKPHALSGFRVQDLGRNPKPHALSGFRVQDLGRNPKPHTLAGFRLWGKPQTLNPGAYGLRVLKFWDA